MSETNDIFEPKLPVVPEKWEILPFVRAAEAISDQGKKVNKKEYLETGKFQIIDQGQEYVGGYTDQEDLVFEGDLPVIVFGDHTRAFKYVDKPFVVGADGVKIIRPKEFFVPKYFYYLLLSLNIPSRGYSRHFQFLRKFYLPIAPFEQQKRIVAEIEKQFSRLDKAVTNLQRVKANLTRYKAAVLKAAVEGKLTEDWRKQNPDVEPASKLLKRILAERRTKWEEAEFAKMKAQGKVPKDDRWKSKYKGPVSPEKTVFSDLPKGWVWVSIDQIASPGSNSITDGPFGSNLKTEHYRTSGPRVIRLQNIKDGVFSDEYAHITEEHFEKLRKHQIHAGDLVIASLGANPPRACIIPSFVGAAIVKADCIRFKPHSEFNPFYLNTALNSQPTRQRVRKLLHGIGRPRIPLGKMRSIALPIPPPEEQYFIVSEIEQQLSVICGVEAQVDANLKKSERLRQTILQKAFSGELVNAEPTDEPASMLLERVGKTTTSTKRKKPHS